MSEAQILAGNPFPGQNWMGTILEKVRHLLRTKSIEDLDAVVNPSGSANLHPPSLEELTPEACFNVVHQIVTKKK